MSSDEEGYPAATFASLAVDDLEERDSKLSLAVGDNVTLSLQADALFVNGMSSGWRGGEKEVVLSHV